MVLYECSLGIKGRCRRGEGFGNAAGGSVSDQERSAELASSAVRPVPRSTSDTRFAASRAGPKP
eukprot:scaffold1616_cov310-Pinguiococcus_pyrenoidosus.AAC.14